MRLRSGEAATSRTHFGSLASRGRVSTKSEIAEIRIGCTALSPVFNRYK
jgi:hypothetical protein